MLLHNDQTGSELQGLCGFYRTQSYFSAIVAQQRYLTDNRSTEVTTYCQCPTNRRENKSRAHDAQRLQTGATASHQGGDVKLCLTVPSVSTGATRCGSSLGCKMLLLYVFFSGKLLQAFPAGALLSSSLHTAFLPILAFLHPNWFFVPLLCSVLVS